MAREPVVVDLGVEELRQEVVAALDLALVEHLVEVRVDALAGLVPHFVHLEHGGTRGADDVVLELEEQVEIVVGEPEQPEEHGARERDRDRAVELALT